MSRLHKTMLAMSVAAAFSAAGVLAANDYVILEVGDHEIRKSQVQAIWQGLFPGDEAPDFETVEEPIRQNVLRGAVSEYLLYEQALEAELDEQEKIRQQIEQMRRKILVRAFINRKSDELVSKEDVKAEYDRLVRESRDQEEVRARHILVEEKKTAEEIKQKLEDGESFEALAKEFSKDPGSKARGGDLGYFTEGNMVKAFEEAAFALDEGEISEPVESSFGWHIIKLEDRRDVTMPTFADMREQLRKNLVEQRLNDYVNDVLDQTDITYYGPDGDEKELSKVPDSTKE